MTRLVCKSLLALLLCVSYAASAQVSVLVYKEDFNSGTAAVSLNNYKFGPAANTGSNRWVINDEYNGNGKYPNTPDQNSTSFGTIAGAPYSNCLHIHDSASAAITTNTNYNSADSSDNLVMLGGHCTLGLENVTFSFFYIAGGSASAYGDLYYSFNGKNWILKSSGYANQSIWKYETVTDTAWSNKPSVVFAFRWRNNAGAAGGGTSMAVDDIFLAGDYNSSNPVVITVTDVTDTVCTGGPLQLDYQLSRPLCTGSYEIELSKSTGTFPGISLGVISIYGGVLTGATSVPAIPSSVVPGTCYKLRIKLSSSTIPVTSTPSVCFVIKTCPNTLSTLQPAVTHGPDTLCVGSAIDVPFYSTGVFKTNNKYIAQLSDANGSFTSPTTIGSVTDAATYDPSIFPYSPGSVAGTVPSTAAGCNYYIRVVATSPSVTPPPAGYYGPFCLKRCDIETNQKKDVQACISQTTGTDINLTYKVRSWSSTATYLTGNQFHLQVLDTKTYKVVNTGVLGSVSTISSGSIQLHIPSLPGLLALPMKLGSYYLRVVATKPKYATDSLGTLVRLTIGAPDTVSVFTTDTIACRGDLVELYAMPYKPQNGTYEWLSPILNGGKSFTWDYDPLTISISSSTPLGEFWARVQQNSYGCIGPWSDTARVTIIDKPTLTLTGPNPVCEGDTVIFKVPFQQATYYAWFVTHGQIVDTSNNEIRVLLDSAGVIQLNVIATNKCGSAATNKIVTVLTQAKCDSMSVGLLNMKESLDAAWGLYPNPVKDRLTVFAVNGLNGDIELKDLTGHSISSYVLHSSSGQLNIDAGNLPAGIYLVILKSAGGMVSVKKFVKE